MKPDVIGQGKKDTLRCFPSEMGKIIEKAKQHNGAKKKGGGGNLFTVSLPRAVRVHRVDRFVA